jgi:signal transduction histidine kinase/DNA-binding response OmpR family regulator
MEKEKERLARRDIQQKDELLLAVNDAAAMLFAPDVEQFEDSLNKSMEIIARSTGVDRVFIWKINIAAGIVHYKPILQWANAPALRVTEPEGFSSPFSEYGSDWAAKFSQGASINGPLNLLSPALRDLFSPYGALSILAVPIFVQDHPWGFISFDDCHQKRRFSAEVVSILKSSSLLIANAVIHNEMTQSLIQAKEVALASARAKSDFLARMSHEIRTPLNAVLGLSEVELQGSLPGKTRLNLEKIHHSGSHLLEIVNDILDISKIESGNFEINPAEYELYGVINDVIQINILRIGIKPVEFKLEIDETVPSKLYGDELRIKQILNNILSNAFKYTEEGRVRLVISWERMDDTALLAFTVEDTGRGIKQEDLEKLFSEYTQFEAAANRRIEGTGLGLSIAKGLAEAMGGSIVAESEYGKGSVFRVRLPQRIVDETPVGAEQAGNLRSLRFSADRSRGRGANLVRSHLPYGKTLVVDDLETNLDVMKGLLMPYGLRVDTALSGQEAVEAIRKEEVRYDLVFMDHMMPGMDGIEAARIIRNEIGTPYARQVTMVALTANALAGNREMFLNNGFTDFISKPIDIYQLDMLLNRWIRDKQSDGALQDAENRRVEQAEGDGGFGESQADAEGAWLLERPVEGIDFAAALALYGNSGAACLPILKSFVAHTPLLLEKMDGYLEASLPDYAIAVHGLKGTCNAIGAGGTAEAARELEFAAREGNEELLLRKHGALRREALALTERLKALLDEWKGGGKADQKDRRAEPDRALLARLSVAAAEFNSNAVEELLEELERCRYEQGEELVEWLREQAENFDYEAMHKRLEAGAV